MKHQSFILIYLISVCTYGQVEEIELTELLELESEEYIEIVDELTVDYPNFVSDSRMLIANKMELNFWKFLPVHVIKVWYVIRLLLEY